MSQTFTLKGDSYEITNNYFPPIILNENNIYCLGLIGFHTFNTIPNIESGNNKFHYNNLKKEEKTITIPTGSYEINDIEIYIKKVLQETAKDDNNVWGAVKTPFNNISSEVDNDNIISIKANNNTLKCEIKSKYEIDFTRAESVGRLLGFSGKKLRANQLHESDLPVEIIKVSSIRIECNIVSESFYDGKPSHTLFEFSPNVDPGFAINIEPRNILYMPVKTRYIDNITIRILDQLGRIINFRGEQILIRLELKNLSY